MTLRNLAQLIQSAAADYPEAPYGTFDRHDGLAAVHARSVRVADALRNAGLCRGDIVALVGENSGDYLVTWMAMQLCGLQSALINPTYPDELLADMIDDLAPQGIVWIGRAPGALTGLPLLQIDATHAWSGLIEVVHPSPDAAARPQTGNGADCAPSDISSFIHTSGTTGRPKFCALSHGYFLRLGRFFADTLCLSSHDRVCAPLPLFHINPMGYGVIGALTAGAGLLSMEKFKAPQFWQGVKAHAVTAIILHAPPASLLKAKTTRDDARGHRVRIGFLCDPAFLAQFDIPVGVGAYGSTEAGGLCHSWHFRAGDCDLPEEGATHMAGQPRQDVEHRIADDGEIWVRGKQPDTLFAGYAHKGQVTPHLDAQGWFRTGDRGRLDDCGNLVFIERMSEAIRVNGEYVPIDFVESRLRQALSLAEFALWRVDSPTKGHTVVLYTTATDARLDEIQQTLADLPRYMHPEVLVQIELLPRDPGVGKIQRRLLNDQARIRVRSLP